ncbi:unnamed protein product [Clavelina lepadiformis]|uniref:C-type lectin domain-containing protein n=1 Tax=Clavelina lepadiformis TaxID=159417 RepID=A0ABP0FNZ2_CLALP
MKSVIILMLVGAVAVEGQFCGLFRKCGVKGAKGDKGEMGEMGAKGEMGNPGIDGASPEVIQQIQADILSIKNDLKWIPMMVTNGYQYYLATTEQNWQASRDICTSMGGDLAVNGMKDLNTRQSLLESILPSVTSRSPWIGLTDAQQEGVWKWVDGTEGTPENVHWFTNQPDNLNGNQNCGTLRSVPDPRADDDFCTVLRFALCERLFSFD